MLGRPLLLMTSFTVPPQSKELKIQNNQLQQVNVSLGSEVEKLQKQLEQARTLQGGDSQLFSLQEELENMREQLQEASLQKKKMEEEHSTEKLDLQQVRGQDIGPSKQPDDQYFMRFVCILMCLQRVLELETENALLKSEKEELNQRILQQSSSTEGENRVR